MPPKPRTVPPAPAAKPAAPAAPEPQDIGNDVVCDNPDAQGNCGHTGALHDDGPDGANTGACTSPGCDCAAMVPDESEPADGAPAKPGAAPAAGPKKGVNPFPPKRAASVTEGEAGTLRVVLDDGTEFDMAGFAAPGDEPVVEPDPVDPLAFTIPVMVVEGITTGDRRKIAPGALTTRPLPLSLMAVTSTTMGHDGAELVGRIDSMERYDASELIDERTGEPYGPDVWAWRGAGVFTDLDNAQTVAKLIGDNFLRGLSVDMSDVTSTLDFLDADGNPIDDSMLDEDEWISFDSMMETVTEGRLMGATVCPFPAFEGAYIVLGDGSQTPQVDDPDAAPALAADGSPMRRRSITFHDTYGERTCAACDDGRVLVASAGPMAPPRVWFDNPGFTGPTALTVTEDGRVFGHIATWGTCHTGVTNSCVMAPRSRTNYGHYRLKSVLTAEGDLVSTGTITMGVGHADLNLGMAAALAHYDNTGTAVADVGAGEDQYGIWIAGALRPDVSDLQVRTLRASALSGDWRRIGNNLELMATLAVNVPGFPVVRELVASGAPMSLVAAGGRGVIQARSEADHEDVQQQLRDAISRLDQYVIAGTLERARTKMQRLRQG